MSYNPQSHSSSAATVPISLRLSRPGTTDVARAYPTPFVYPTAAAAGSSSNSNPNQISNHLAARSASRGGVRTTPTAASRAAESSFAAVRPPNLPAPASPQLRGAEPRLEGPDSFFAPNLRLPQQPVPPSLPVPLPLSDHPPAPGIWSVKGSDSLPKRGRENTDQHPASSSTKMVTGLDSAQRWKSGRLESSGSTFLEFGKSDFSGLWNGELETSSSPRPFAAPPSAQLPLFKRSPLMMAAPPSNLPPPIRWPPDGGDSSPLYKPRIGDGMSAFAPNSSSIIQNLLRTRATPSRSIHSTLLRGTELLAGRRSFLAAAKPQEPPPPLGPQIVDVWAHNLEEEFVKIRDVVDRYQYVAMDTEFPGVVARPTGNCTDYHYKTIKYNVDLLKVIQLGVTFADEKGRVPPGTSTWQFNFKFDLGKDMYAEDAIKFLTESGIDFATHQNNGIEIQEFGEVIMSSGLVMNKAVKWISFHGSYDFGYLLKLLTCAPLPDSEKEFFELLCDFFPSLYDIKYLLIHCENLKNETSLTGSSLQRVAEHLEVQRVGPQHQAGSDSLVTCRTFFRLMETYFDNLLDDSKFSGVIYGFRDSMGIRRHQPTVAPGDSHTEWFEAGLRTPPSDASPPDPAAI